MCNNTNMIDELVAELDNFFQNGGSHMNIEFNPDGNSKTIKINYTECKDGENACGIPTEFFNEEEE